MTELCTHIKGALVRGCLLSDMPHESGTINHRVIIVIVKNAIINLEEQRNKILNQCQFIK